MIRSPNVILSSIWVCDKTIVSISLLTIFTALFLQPYHDNVGFSNCDPPEVTMANQLMQSDVIPLNKKRHILRDCIPLLKLTTIHMHK